MKGFVYSVSTKEDTIILHFKTIIEGKIVNKEAKINNFELNFFMKKPAFISKKSFENHLNELRTDKGIYWTTREFYDGNWTNAVSKQSFYEIFGKYHSIISAFKDLRKYVIVNMTPNIDNWEFLDEVDYNNTENPFRYSRFLSPSSWQFILSTRYNISICGINKFDSLNVEFMGDISRKDISKVSPYSKIVSTKEDFDAYIKILSYDIETYTPDNMSPLEEKHEIMCIGICFFILSSPIPYRRICLITKPVEKNIKPNFYEFAKDDPIESEYVSFSSEKEMLKAYIKLISEEDPLIICGFNNYGFDDRFVYERMKRYNLENEYVSLFSYDNTAVYKRFKLKIDGIPQDGNYTVLGNKIFSLDVYKYMLKANPKLYTQQSKGNLNSMLSLNKIKSPWDGVSDVQKTGLTYQQMFDYWDANIKIRDIAYYCLNDGFCAGLLLIKMGLLQDKIKLGETSCSSLHESLFKEVSEKILTKIEEFGWHNDFCLSDNILDIDRPKQKGEKNK